MGAERLREVLAVRGRLREVPWYSLLHLGLARSRATGGRTSVGREYQAPTAAGRPGASRRSASASPRSRVGTARRTSWRSRSAADKPATRCAARPWSTVQVNLPDGKPAAGAEVALAAVDEALLELHAQQQLEPARGHAAAAQLGRGDLHRADARSSAGGTTAARRCRPAAAAAGRRRANCSTRCCCGTRAWCSTPTARRMVEVPLNDALTAFASSRWPISGAGLFGTGQASIRATQDLQMHQPACRRWCARATASARC